MPWKRQCPSNEVIHEQKEVWQGKTCVQYFMARMHKGKPTISIYASLLLSLQSLLSEDNVCDFGSNEAMTLLTRRWHKNVGYLQSCWRAVEVFILC